MVDHFLIEYPDDPAADQAAFSGLQRAAGVEGLQA